MEEGILQAIKEGKILEVKTLIDRGLSVDKIIDSSQKTPLLLASTYKKKEIVLYLIGIGANVNAKDKYGFTALIESSINGHTEIVKILLEAGATIEQKSKENLSALQYAIQWNQIEIVKLLLKAGSNPNVKDAKGSSALTQAILVGNTKIVKLLLKAGANIHEKDINGLGRRPLVVAAQLGNIDIIKQLLNADACIALDNSDIIWGAINSEDFTTLNYLIEAGANVNNVSRLIDGTTILMWSIVKNCPDIVAILLKAGADMSAKNNQGKTAMDLAVEKNKNHIISLINKARNSQE